MKNNNIYNNALALNKEFANCEIKLPVRINFFLQRNIQKMVELGQEIEKARMEIFSRYGTKDKNGNFNFTNENTILVNQELNELFNIEQELDIHIFKLSEFDGLEFTYKQMSALMFMIEED